MGRCRGSTSNQPQLESLLKRTDMYFAEVGLLPFILRFPVEGKADSLKRGILRNCIQCSQYINDEIRCALLKGSLPFIEVGTTKEGILSNRVVNPDPSYVSRSKAKEKRKYSDIRCHKSDCSSVSSTSPLVDTCLAIQKLRLIAWELGDEGLKSQCDPPLLGANDLKIEYLREVVNLVDSCASDGFLLLLCERRSPNFSGDCKRSIDTVIRPNEHQVSERLKVEQMEDANQPSVPDFALGVVAGGIGCITEGRRELKSIFCIQDLPEDGMNQLVRVLTLRLLAHLFLWPSTTGQADEHGWASQSYMQHFTRDAREFICLPGGLHWSQHFDNKYAHSFHTDNSTHCQCQKKWTRLSQMKSSGHSKSSAIRKRKHDDVEEDTAPHMKGEVQRNDATTEEWNELWAISITRFCSAWKGSNSRWVPDQPARSLLEAFNGPSKF